MSMEIVQIIKECSKKSEKPYQLLYSKNQVSNPISISIHIGVQKVLQENGLEVAHKHNSDASISNGKIYLPSKEQFYSNSNYNHVVLHELNHRLSMRSGLSVDYVNSYIKCSKDKESSHDFNGLIKAFQENKQNNLTSTEKALMAAYSKDETAVEISSYLMMKKLGIQPDGRDTGYMQWNISENNKTLEKMGMGFTKNYMTLNEIFQRTENLLSITTKAYEQANGICLDNVRPKEKERER